MTDTRREIRGQISELWEQMSEVRGQIDIKGQISEVGAPDGGQTSAARIQKFRGRRPDISGQISDIKGQSSKTGGPMSDRMSEGRFEKSQ